MGGLDHRPRRRSCEHDHLRRICAKQDAAAGDGLHEGEGGRSSEARDAVTGTRRVALQSHEEAFYVLRNNLAHLFVNMDEWHTAKDVPISRHISACEVPKFFPRLLLWPCRSILYRG